METRKEINQKQMSKRHNMFKNFQPFSILKPPTFESSEKTYRSLILYYLTIIVMFGSVTALIWYALITIPESTGAFTVFIPVFSFIAFIIIGLVVLRALHKGNILPAGRILLLSLMIIITGVSLRPESLENPSYVLFFLIIVSAGGILGRREGVLFSALSIIGVGLMTYMQYSYYPDSIDFSRPITYFVVAILVTLVVNSSSQAFQETLEEARNTANTLEVRNIELEKISSSLESTIKDRTSSLERRSQYLEAAAEVGHAATSIYNLEELLPQVVNFISERFGFYQVGIFILDDTREYAVMRAASSEGGKQMLARNHQLKVGTQGIVGFVTGTRQARIALDVGEDAVHFDNPELPHTRSEMALPLFSGDNLFGALDVQSTEPNAFSEEDISALRVLANQVSMAINNAQLFGQLQESIESERRAYGEIRRDAWKEIIRAKKHWGYRYSDDEISPSSGKWSEDMIQAAKMGETIHNEMDNVPTLSIPIQVSNQVVGVVRVRKDINQDKWSEDDIELMETITDRLSQTLESARLFQTTQKQAAQEQITSEISSSIRQSLDIDTVLQTAAKELGEVFKAEDIVIRMKHDSTPEE
jgi:GAF domain-containing protein